MPTAVVWDPALLEYRFHATHPMDPVRLDLTQRLCREFGILDDPLVRMISPGIAEDETLLSVHDAGYVDAVKTAASGGQASAVHGLGTEDTPVFPRCISGPPASRRGVWNAPRRSSPGRRCTQ